MERFSGSPVATQAPLFYHYLWGTEWAGWFMKRLWTDRRRRRLYYSFYPLNFCACWCLPSISSDSYTQLIYQVPQILAYSLFPSATVCWSRILFGLQKFHDDEKNHFKETNHTPNLVACKTLVFRDHRLLIVKWHLWLLAMLFRLQSTT